MERRNLFCLLDDLFYAHCVRHLQFKLLFHLLHEIDFYAGVSFFIVHSWGYDDCLKTSEEMARLPLGFIRQSYNNTASAEHEGYGGVFISASCNFKFFCQRINEIKSIEYQKIVSKLPHFSYKIIVWGIFALRNHVTIIIG